MCCGGFGGGGGGGGGGGNLLGTLTAPFIPYASGAHTLVDGPLSVNAGTGEVTTLFDFSVGTDIHLDASLGEITSAFLHVTSDAAIDGLLTLGAAGMNVNAGKFILDGATGGFTTLGPTDFKDQMTIEKSTVLVEVAVPIVASVATIDAYLSDFFSVQVNAAITFAPPTNPGDGRRFMLRIDTDGDGPYAITWDLNFNFQNATDPVIDTSLGAPTSYYLGFVWKPGTNKWDCVGNLSGPFSL